MVRDMQTQVADAVTEAFVAIEKAFGDIEAEVVELLQEEQLGLPQRTGPRAQRRRDEPVERRSRSTRRPRQGQARLPDRASRGIRGVQSGMYMFSSIGSWLPTAAGALLIANPVHDRRGRAVRRHAAARRAQEEGDDAPAVGAHAGAPVPRQRAVRGGQRDRRRWSARCSGTCATSSPSGSASCSAPTRRPAQRAQADVQKSQQERQQRSPQGAQACWRRSSPSSGHVSADRDGRTSAGIRLRGRPGPRARSTRSRRKRVGHAVRSAGSRRSASGSPGRCGWRSRAG